MTFWYFTLIDDAVKYYKLAADQGHEMAQNNLGVCYKKGAGENR